MPRKYGVVLCSSLAVVAFLALSAQSVFAAAEGESELWTAFKLKVPVADGFSFFAHPQLRYQGNWEQFYYERSDFGLSIRLSDRWRVEPLYRYLRKKGASGWDQSDLFFTDLYFTVPFASNLEFENRVRWEYDFGSDFQGARERAKVSMKLPDHKGLKLFASDEIFYDLSNEMVKENRVAVGVNKKFDSGVSVELAYQLTSRHKPGDWTNAHVTLVNFGYTL